MSKPRKLESGRWQIRWFDADGKRQSRTFATYDLARKELARSEVVVDEQRVLRERLGGGALTVREAFKVFMAERKPDPGNTLRRFEERGRAYHRAFTHHIDPHLGDVKLCDLAPPVLRGWLNKLAVTPTQRPGEKNEPNEGGKRRTLSASTIRAVMVTLRQLAAHSDVPIIMPRVDSLRQKRRRTRPRALQSLADVRAFLAACRDPWFRVACALACYVGARLGEIASLRWRHLADGKVTIALSWEGPLKHRYEDEDEDDCARVVPFGAELASILDLWREATGGGPNDRVVLVHGKGAPRPLHEGYDAAEKTRAACRRAGLPELTFHSLRASYATIAADQGLPISTLKVLLGHSDVSTTSIYIRPEATAAAADPRAILGGTIPARPAGDGGRMAN